MAGGHGTATSGTLEMHRLGGAGHSMRAQAGAMTQESHDARPLGQAVGRGLTWSLGGQIVMRLLSFGTGVVMARLLVPEDFGAFAVALLAVNVLSAVNELGTIPAVVRWKGDPQEALPTGMTLACAGSVAMYLLVWFGAPAFASSFSNPEAVWVLRVFALTILLDGLNAMPQALLYRSFRQAEFALAELAGTVGYAVVGIVMAWAGSGAMSMAWGRVAGAFITAALFYAIIRFRPRFGFDRRVARELLVFGMPLGISHLVWEGVMNIDYYVVGAVLGTTTLGFYLLAFNLSSWPVSTISYAVQKVSFAAFSRLVDDKDRLPESFGRSMGVALTVTLPCLAVLIVLTPEIIGFLYGEQWLPAAVAARVLLLLGGVRVLMDLVFDLVAADGRSRTTLALRSLWLVALVPALYAGARLDGLRGVGTAHVIVALVVVLPLLLRTLRGSGVPLSALLPQVVRPGLATAASVVAMLLVLPFVSGDLLTLVAVGAVGGAVYVAAILPANPLVRWTIKQIVPDRAAAGSAA